MSSFAGWGKALIVTGVAMTAAACASYPTEPRYSTRPTQPGQYPQGQYPQGGNAPGQYPNGQYQPPAPYEAPPPSRAPIESIEGGALSSPTQPSSNTYPPASSYPHSGNGQTTVPPYNPVPMPPPPAPRPSQGSAVGGAAYVIQPGDTISGVGRRFQTPVQTLIDLNGLGPRGAITSGQRILLPNSAVDTGNDPYATGPTPVGVSVPRGSAPPPPPPPSGNAALPPPAREPARPQNGNLTNQPLTLASTLALQWPVRGDILRRFGPAGMGERNNGINIGASAGAAVNAAAAGRVAYVGDDIVGQGLTVVVVHRDGWRTVYSHLGSSTVRDNDDVRAGQQVGTVGLTAGDGRPSIHFETRKMQGDNPVAVDPLTVLPR